jgi:hypothetical protein
MAFTATNTQLDRYFRKAALGQAAVVANSQTDITLAYHRFDPDTGERIDDEVMAVDYAAILSEHTSLTTIITAQQTRLDTLAVVLAYLDSIIPTQP